MVLFDFVKTFYVRKITTDVGQIKFNTDKNVLVDGNNVKNVRKIEMQEKMQEKRRKNNVHRQENHTQIYNL